jgi:predicted aspartyl protease
MVLVAIWPIILNHHMQGRTYVDPAGVTGHRVSLYFTKKIVVFVYVNVGGHPVKYLLDTGAERISLDAATGKLAHKEIE